MEFLVTQDMIINFIYGVIMVFLVYFTIKQGTKIIKMTNALRKNKKKYLEGMAKVKEMKANGDFHEWVDIPILGEIRHVCKKTLYCPVLEGFITKEYFDGVMAVKADQERFSEFKCSRLDEICEKFNISFERLRVMMEEISTIPVEYVKNKIKEKGSYELKVDKNDQPIQ